MPELFKWSVCILDDAPDRRVKGAEQLLTDKQFTVRNYGTNRDYSFLSVPRPGITDSHFFLVDMQWEGNDEGGFFCEAPRLDEAVSKKDAIVAFVEGLKLDGRVGPGEQPPVFSQDLVPDSLGIWIACAISYLNPDGRLYFFSGHKELQNNRLTKALLRYNNAPLRLLSKDGFDRVLTTIDSDLRVWQRRVLHYSDEAYRWFVWNVLLRVMIGKEPESGEVGRLYPTDQVGAWKLHATTFFPQWPDWAESGRLLQELATFLRQSPYKRPSNEKMALSGIRHIARQCRDDLRRGAQTDDLTKRLSKAIDLSFSVGFEGRRVKDALERATVNLEEATLDAVFKACDFVDSNRLVDLYDYCLERRNDYNHQKSCYECEAGVAKTPTGLHAGSVGTSPAEPELPFAIHHLRHVINALIVNGQDHQPSGSTFTCFLHVLDKGQCLEVEYGDNSIGFTTGDEFREKVLGSLNKRAGGIDDGLPLALTFGAFYTLGELSVKLNSGKWEQLFSGSETSRGASQPGFGMRWVFRL